MLLPLVVPVLYFVGSWAVHTMQHVSYWRQYGYGTFGNLLIKSTMSWCGSWENHLAIFVLIALSTGIVCLVLHLILPHADRPHD